MLYVFMLKDTTLQRIHRWNILERVNSEQLGFIEEGKIEKGIKTKIQSLTMSMTVHCIKQRYSGTCLE